MDWEELGIDKQEVEKFMKKAKEEDQPESGEQEESNDNEKFSNNLMLGQWHLSQKQQ